MLQKIKLPFGISAIEAITISSFIAIGFSILYKIGYYNSLGFPWLINTLNPQLILITSIKFLFLFITFFVLGILISNYLRINSISSFLILVLSPFALLLVLAIIKNYYNSSFFYKFDSSILYSIFFSFTYGVILSYGYSVHFSLFKNLKSKIGKLLILISIISLGFLTLVFTPYSIGKFDAFYLINTPYYQNVVKIQNSLDKEIWIIADIINDKAIIYELKSKKIKVIELKEITYIKSYKSYLKTIDNQAINTSLKK